MEHDKEDAVNFYEPDKQYGQFSNVFVSPYTINEVLYKSNEHYFQSKKFQGTSKEPIIISADSPYDAFEIGNSRVGVPMRADWQEVKEGHMLNGLRQKFTQNEACRKKLLETGNRKIIEHTVKDSYWGDGGDGKGGNRLGILLMQVREEIKNSEFK